MAFGQIKARALELIGENPEDIPLFDDLVGAYVNEGYHDLLQRALRPRACALLELQDDGENGRFADLRALPRLVQVLRVRLNGRPVPFLVDNLRLYPLARGEEPLSIDFVRDEDDLELDADIPRLPAWSHPALCDFAAFRLCAASAGDRAKRADFFHARFLEASARLSSRGPLGPAIPNRHGLRACT